MYSVFVHTKEQYEVVKNYPVSMIYTDNESLLKEDENIYYQVPRYPHTKKLPQNILIQDLGCLLECQNKNIVTDTNLNVANSLAIEKLLSFVPCCNFCILLYSDVFIFFDNIKYIIKTITNSADAPPII